MTKPPSPSSHSIPESTRQILSPTVQISNDLPSGSVDRILVLLNRVGVTAAIPHHCDTQGFFSDVVSCLLKPLSISPGRITCLLTVKPFVTNIFKTLHGGALGAVAEAISVACARTVVAKDKEIFLGEQSMTYLSGAPQNAEVIVDAQVLRSGRTLTVVALDFKLKKTQKLIYTARSTFYNMPLAKL